MVGAAGVVFLVASKEWEIDERLYFGNRNCVFTATRMGQIQPISVDVL